jgi:hypothetical protein
MCIANGNDLVNISVQDQSLDVDFFRSSLILVSKNALMAKYAAGKPVSISCCQQEWSRASEILTPGRSAQFIISKPIT